MELSCDRVKYLLPEYLLGETYIESNIAIEQHIGSCPDCKKELDEAKRVLDAFQAPIYNETYTLIQQAIVQKASHIYIDVRNSETEIRFRKQGQLEPYKMDFTPGPDDIMSGDGDLIISRLKRMSDVTLHDDISEGRIGIGYLSRNFTLKTKFYTTNLGQSAVVYLQEPFWKPGFEDIQLSEAETGLVKRALTGTTGLIILSGDDDGDLRIVRLVLASYLSDDGRRAVYDIEPLTPRAIFGVTSVPSGESLSEDIDRIIAYDPDVISISSSTDTNTIDRVLDYACTAGWTIIQADEPILNSLLETGIIPNLVIKQKAILTYEKPRVNPKFVYEITTNSGCISFEESINDLVSKGLLRQREADLAFAPERVLSSKTIEVMKSAYCMIVNRRGEIYDVGLEYAVASDSTLQDTFCELGIDRFAVLDTINEMSDPDDPTASLINYTWGTDSVVCIASLFAGSELVEPKHLLQAMLFWGSSRDILIKAGGTEPGDPIA